MRHQRPTTVFTDGTDAEAAIPRLNQPANMNKTWKTPTLTYHTNMNMKPARTLPSTEEEVASIKARQNAIDALDRMIKRSKGSTKRQLISLRKQQFGNPA